MDSKDRAKKQTRWVAAFLLGTIVVCTASYLPAMSGELFFDDIPLLVRNTCWRGLEKIPAMFGFGEGNSCTYRPGRYLTFAVDYSVAGMNPIAFHVSNLIYHLLTLLAVFALFRRWGDMAPAALMTAIWALHPVHADAVAYISGRRDVFSTLLYVLAFLRLMPPKGERLTIGRVVLGLALFGLAMRTKEMAVTLPAVLIWAGIVNYSGQLGGLKAHLRKRWPLYLALMLCAGTYFVFRAVLFPHTNMQGKWWGGTFGTNFATVFSLYAHYFRLVVWPATLIGDYFPVTIPVAKSFLEPTVVIGMGMYLGMVGLTVVSLRRGWRATAFGMGWFLITMLPVSHIFPHHELFAEHFLYLPMIGLGIAFLPLVDRLLRSKLWVRRVTILTACLVSVAFSVRTADRSADYQSGRVFFETAHELAPNNARILYNLGLTYLNAQECERAVPLVIGAAQYLRRGGAMARSSVASFLHCAEQVGRFDLVNSLVGALLTRYPEESLGFAWAGRRLLEAGDLTAAIAYLTQAIDLGSSRDPAAVAMLALALNEADDHEQALAMLRRYPHRHRGHCEQEVRALIKLGVNNYEEAFTRSQRCLLDYPDSLLLLEFRAALYFASGRLAQGDADLARLETLGANEVTLERVRGLRPVGQSESLQ